MYGGSMIHEEYLGGNVDAVATHVETAAQKANSAARAIRMVENQVNYMWYINQPFISRRPGTTRIRYLHPSHHAKFIQVNLSFDAVRTLRGVMHYVPKCEARPKSPDPEDAARARLAATIGDSIIENGNLSSAYSRVLELVHVTGGAWLTPVWDPMAGHPRVSVDQIPCPACNGTGMVTDDWGMNLACQTCSAQGVMTDNEGNERGMGEIPQTDEAPEGDVVFEVINETDMLVDPGARRMEDAHYFTRRHVMHASRAWQRWGQYAGYSESDLLANTSSIARDAVFFPSFGPTQKPSSNDGYVALMEHWERPSEKFPNGLFAVTCGRLVLSAGPLPRISTVSWNPFFFFPLYQVEGMLYPLSTIDLIQQLVQQHADHLSMAAARARHSAQMRFVTTRQQGIQVDDQTGMLVYNHVPGAPVPAPIQLGGAGGEIGAVTQALEAAIQQVSAASDAARGKYDANTTDNATAMALIEERSTAPLKPIMSEHQSILQKVVRWAIDLARINYEDGRMIRLAGNAGAPEVHAFESENVGESTDVVMRVVKNQGQSRSAMLSQVNEAVTAGWLPHEIALELSEFGDMNNLYEVRAVHRNKAIREFQVLRERGFMPSASENDDQDIHIRDHTIQRATAAINLQDGDPLLLALDQHINTHRGFKAQAAFQAAQGQVIGAAAFGMANAGAASAQPQETVQAAQQAGTVPGPSADPVTENHGPGEQPALDNAEQTAQGFANSMPPNGAQS